VKYRRGQSGQIRTIEAFFASLLILATLAIVPAQLGVEKTHYNDIYATGTQALISMDNDGVLSNRIEDGNWTALKNCIQSMVPVSLWFNLTVFDENMTCLNDIAVSNGGVVSEEIVAVNYVCASSSGNCAVYLVQLQLAEAS
jgi:hypothetical protein